MNLSLRPHPLIAHWVPGVVLVVTALLAYSRWSVSTTLAMFAGDASKATVSVLVLSIAAFVVGEILDAVRDCVADENVNWDFFFDEPSEEKVERLNNYYFTYFVLERNLSSALAVSLLIFVVHPPEWAHWWRIFSRDLSSFGWFALVTVLVVGAICILLRDSKFLEGEIERHTKKRFGKEPPHEGVFTRLGPSKTHEGGVGVFAIRRIPKGTHIFHRDENTELVELDKSVVEALRPELRKLYDDFCIIENNGQLYRCPENFNLMTISWYLNEPRASEQPNVRCGENDLFYALRDIEPGEELTVDYNTYNEFK
jgi:hypothetical protein